MSAPLKVNILKLKDLTAVGSIILRNFLIKIKKEKKIINVF